MFRIRMLPAGYGDCYLIEYGRKEDLSRILIDAGTISTYKGLRKLLETIPKEKRRLELFIVTHIDTDHIDSAVKLLNSSSLKLKCDQIWFNGWKQLIDKDLLGPQQGEYLTAIAEKKNIPINKSFKGKPVFVPEKGKLPTVSLHRGGMVITILSPTAEKLRDLRGEWKKTMGAAAGNAKSALKKLAATARYRDVLGPSKGLDINSLAVADTVLDTSPANGSSIAVLAEFDDKSCLFAADCHPDVLEKSIKRLIGKKTDRLHLDAFKVPHHGSKYNNTRSLVMALNCRRFMVSTDGKIFNHPDPEGIARLIKYGGPMQTLYFNYGSPQTEPWDASELKRKFRYDVVIRQGSAPTLDIEL